jgi:hypothetical protein
MLYFFAKALNTRSRQILKTEHLINEPPIINNNQFGPDIRFWKDSKKELGVGFKAYLASSIPTIAIQFHEGHDGHQLQTITIT